MIIAYVVTMHNMHAMKVFFNKNTLVKPPWSVWARNIGVVVRLGAAHIPLHRTHRKCKHAATRESASRNVEPVDRTGSQ